MATSEPPIQFEEIRERERELSARQRRTLDLIVAGKTNAEIADEFGISLAGAKWHVSEILSKLGLASREDAADYWRWRNRRRVPHALRALGALPSLKWLAGGAGAAGAAAAVAVFVTGLGSSPTPVEATEKPEAIYFEAKRLRPDATMGTRTVMTEADSPIGPAWTVVGDGSWVFTPPRQEGMETARVWQEESDLFRMESEVHLPAIESGQETVVATDGETNWYYASQMEGWTRTEVVRGVKPSTPWDLGMIGDGTFEALFAMLDEQHLEIVSISEGGPVAGRATTMIVAERLQSRWTGWYDADWGLLLKYRREQVSATATFSEEVEVTRVEPMDAAPGVTGFTPPAGSHGIVGSREPDEQVIHGLGGFALVAQPPDGWMYQPGGYSGYGDGTTFVRMGDLQWYLADGSGVVVEVERRRRPDGFPPALDGDDMTIAGKPVEHVERDGQHSIAWADRDVVTEVRGSGSATYEDVVRIAEATLLGPSRLPTVYEPETVPPED